MHAFRDMALYLARGLGGFALARHLTRHRLRILCFHGFSVGDEYELQPHMFMRSATFERRMKILRKRRFPVIPLDEAVRRLGAGAIHRAETVITIDDGWASTLTIAAPILERYGFPACVYLTTEHLTAGTEVFNVALSYMILRSPHTVLHLEGIHPDLDGAYELRKDPNRTLIALIRAAEKACPALADRQRLLAPLAAALAVDPAKVLCKERFRLLTGAQIRELAGRGFAIEMHTHSHRLPDESFDSMAAEVERNRTELQAVLGKRPSHFCYPSGEYRPQHPQWLRRLGIASGTTCDPGLNAPGTSPFLLKRFLDSDGTSDIAFEAELMGFRELVRMALAPLRARRGDGTASTTLS